MGMEPALRADGRGPIFRITMWQRTRQRAQALSGIVKNSIDTAPRPFSNGHFRLTIVDLSTVWRIMRANAGEISFLRTVGKPA
jgi:hypothetical protein